MHKIFIEKYYIKNLKFPSELEKNIIFLINIMKIISIKLITKKNGQKFRNFKLKKWLKMANLIISNKSSFFNFNFKNY